ncbi:MAG: hypothetical protein FJX59_01270 [Alphaproteobacteria bacterium]|nr:hypothetical protein [Alphaproteobacteria bacterium]
MFKIPVSMFDSAANSNFGSAAISLWKKTNESRAVMGECSDAPRTNKRKVSLTVLRRFADARIRAKLFGFIARSVFDLVDSQRGYCALRVRTLLLSVTRQSSGVARRIECAVTMQLSRRTKVGATRRRRFAADTA